MIGARLLIIPVTVVVVLLVSPALGGPTLFLTKQRANRIFLKKRETRNFATPAEAKAAPVGGMRIGSGPSAWTLGPVTNGPSPQVTYFLDSARVRSNQQAAAFLELQPSIPTLLYDQPTKLTGLEFCYSASQAARIDFVSLNVGSGSVGDPVLTQASLDATTREDQTCRSYSASVVLGPTDFVSLTVGANFQSKGDLFLGRTAFLLEP